MQNKIDIKIIIPIVLIILGIFIWYCTCEKKCTDGRIMYSELRKHNKKNDCWVVINDTVYDISKLISTHSGGQDVLLKLCGTNATKQFDSQHDESYLEDLTEINKYCE